MELVRSTEGDVELITGDLLYGVKAIAKFLGMRKDQCQHRCDEKRIPTFRIGRNIVARKTTLARWVEDMEAAGTEPEPTT